MVANSIERAETWSLLVVMGVSAAGKSVVGLEIAQEIGVPFIDADSLHPAANVKKMTAGLPLNDGDREPWLEAVSRALAHAAESGEGLVIACSALKRKYRDIIRWRAPGVVFVHLHANREVLSRRIRLRLGHFMPESLLDSQLAVLEALEPNESGVVIDVDGTVSQVVLNVKAALEDLPSSEQRNCS